MARRILIADDEENFLEILSYSLCNEGFDVIAVTDGQGVLNALFEQPELITLDITIPELSGYEVCKTIRDQGVNIPIIFLTARDSNFDELQGF